MSSPEKEGVFMVPHRLFEWVHKCIDSKNERTVFLCLLRYSLGYWNSEVEASRTYISMWTGLDVSNVRKALKALREQGLIVLKEEAGPRQQSAVFSIPIIHELFTQAESQNSDHDSKAGGNLTPGQSAPEEAIHPPIKKTH